MQQKPCLKSLQKHYHITSFAPLRNRYLCTIEPNAVEVYVKLRYGKLMAM